MQHICPWWLTYTFDNPLRRLLHPPELVLGRWVRPGMTVLDIGCGIGHFTLGMARLVGAGGRVIAVDLQERSLAAVRRRAARAGLDERITTHRCQPERIGVGGPVDFALAFWMVHETPSPVGLFTEVRDALRLGGRLLVAEPRFHVTEQEFEKTLEAAALAGLSIAEHPTVRASRAVLLERPTRQPAHVVTQAPQTACGD